MLREPSQRTALVCTLLVALVLGCAREQAPAEGWSRFEGQKVSLWLPHNYGATVLTEGDAAGLVFQASEAYLLHDDSALPALVFVTRRNFGLFRRLSTYAEEWSAGLPEGTQLLEQGEVDLGCRTVWRVIMAREAYGTTEAAYLVRRGLSLYTIVFSGSSAAFERLLTESERSMCTFRITS